MNKETQRIDVIEDIRIDYSSLQDSLEDTQDTLARIVEDTRSSIEDIFQDLSVFSDNLRELKEEVLSGQTTENQDIKANEQIKEILTENLKNLKTLTEKFEEVTSRFSSSLYYEHEFYMDSTNYQE